MRLIDADKLLQIYRSEQSRMEERQCDRINKANSKSVMLLELECRELEKLSTWIGFCEDIIIDIENAPTIEAAPVVHGEWVPHNRMTRSPLVVNYACSECGKDGHKTNFCPNCGASMKGAKDGWNN